MKKTGKITRKKRWWVYFVRCADSSLYCGIATDVARRVDEHNSSPKAARYTRSRRPVCLVWSEKHPSQSAALKREYQLKCAVRKDKEKLIAHFLTSSRRCAETKRQKRGAITRLEQ